MTASLSKRPGYPISWLAHWGTLTGIDTTAFFVYLLKCNILRKIILFFCSLIWCCYFYWIKAFFLFQQVNLSCYTLIRVASMIMISIKQESAQYLGSPSHMTHDGDQLASYSFSLKVLGCSSVFWVASSIIWTSSALRATAGDAALAFSIATASLWLKLVKSMPLIFSNTSPIQMKKQEKWAESLSIHPQFFLFIN